MQSINTKKRFQLHVSKYYMYISRKSQNQGRKTKNSFKMPQHLYHLQILRPSPHYARVIWKRSFISPVKPSVHTNPEKLSTENGAFRKRSWKTEEFKNGAVRFSVDEKHFQNGAFRKPWRHDNHVICLPESSSNTNPKWRPKWFKRWRKRQSG